MTILALTVLAGLWACKKKCDCAVPNTNTNTSTVSEVDRVKGLLTAHPWKLKEEYYNGGASKIKECDADNLDIYYPNGDYKHDISGIKCFEEQKNLLYAWKLKGKDTLIVDGMSQYGDTLVKWSDTVKVDYITDTTLSTRWASKKASGVSNYVKP